MQDLFAYQGDEPTLSVCSFGAGQDSTAILQKYINDRAFRNKYAPNDFVVVMSDTGNEHAHTYEHIEYTKSLCKSHGIEFYFITKDMGYHKGNWTSLTDFFKAKSAIGSVAYPKICSQQLKIAPIYRFLEDYLGEKYGVKTGKKAGFRQFAKEYGTIRMIIGIASGEEKRMTDASENKAKWYRESIEHCYPLVELGMDRQACQSYISSLGQKVPMPSNCVFCPYLSEPELAWLERFSPEALHEWIGHEARKLNKWKHLEQIETVTKTGKVKIENKNFGVFGRRYLPEMVEHVKEKYADWSDSRLSEYKFSHGHCVKTAF